MSNVHHARLKSTRALADDVVEYLLVLDPEDASIRWRAGQFISVHVGETDAGMPILRSYSLASRPAPGDEAAFRLVLKLVPGGPASEWFRRIQPGERVRFSGPMGFFVLDLSHPGDIVFAATGTGVAPVLPMLEELLERGEQGQAHLYFGARSEGDVFWREEIERLVERSRGRLHATISLTRPAPGWSGATGRITPQVFSLLPRLARPTFYLCGNGAMIREVKAGLVERGVDRKRQIRTEAFFD